MGNLDIWNKLEKTDPKYTKKFDKGVFKGTAINPTYQIQKMTEQFGPCGQGWGYVVTDRQIVPLPGTQEVMVYVTVRLWTGNMDNAFDGVGGDYILRAGKNGLRADDEAMKKATTDALTNAFKFLGMSADVYLGRYDDNKYVESLSEEPKGNGTMSGRLADDPTIKADMAELGYDADKIYNEVLAELDTCTDNETLTLWVKRNKETRRMQGLPKDKKDDVTNRYQGLKSYIESKKNV